MSLPTGFLVRKDSAGITRLSYSWIQSSGTHRMLEFVDVSGGNAYEAAIELDNMSRALKELYLADRPKKTRKKAAD